MKPQAPPFGKKAQEILEFIRAYINKNGISPVIREIGEGVGLRSTSTVQSHLLTLERLGHISHRAYSPRSIRLSVSVKPILPDDVVRLLQAWIDIAPAGCPPQLVWATRRLLNLNSSTTVKEAA